MKRLAAVLLTLLLIFSTSICYAALQSKTIKGGLSRDAAVEIHETKLGSLFSGVTGFDDRKSWFKIQPPVSGDLCIQIRALGYLNGTSMDTILRFYDHYPTHSFSSTDFQIITYNKQYTFVYPVESNRVYYITIESDANADSKFLFSVCLDGYHVPLDKGETIRNPTCSKPGECQYLCELCGYPAKTEEIPKLDHTPGDWVMDVAATCSLPGLNAQHFKVCGEIIASNEIPAAGHGSTETVITTKATCIQAGTSEERCLTCGEKVSSTQIPATGEHIASPMQSVRAATCTSGGKCESRCSVCNTLIHEETTSALGHSTEWETTIEATCIQAGTSEERCLICGEKVSSTKIPATGEHIASPMQSVRAATCTSDGKYESRCSVCNTLIREETTSALGHSYSEWETTIEATKKQEGQRTRICNYCGHIETEQIEKLPKLFGIF